ncbi:MAG: hypothetical protein QOK26_3708, partial [Pseudonocardiales bacterium]|nr:hypothetical protein [Pseudonocardiales bacterium]
MTAPTAPASLAPAVPPAPPAPAVQSASPAPAVKPASPAAAVTPAPPAPVHPVLPPVDARPGHSWAPASPCTPDCLPAAGELAEVGPLRVAARLTGLVVLVLTTAVLAAVLPVVGTRRRLRVLRGMFGAVLAVIGVRLVHTGADRFDLTPD